MTRRHLAEEALQHSGTRPAKIFRTGPGAIAITADATALAAVLKRLLDNAIKSTP